MMEITRGGEETGVLEHHYSTDTKKSRLYLKQSSVDMADGSANENIKGVRLHTF